MSNHIKTGAGNGLYRRAMLCAVMIPGIFALPANAQKSCVTPVFDAPPHSSTAYTSPNNCSPQAHYLVKMADTNGVHLSYSLSGATFGNGTGGGSGVNFNRGNTHVVLTAVNACGTATHGFDIFVRDTIAPKLVHSNITVNVDSGVNGAIVSYSEPTVIDNCPDCAFDKLDALGYSFLGNFKGHTYYRTPVPGFWHVADSLAELAGGHLIAINSAAEDSFFRSIVPDTQLAWMGFTDRDSEWVWKWTSGEPVTYTNWCYGQPDNHKGRQDYAVIHSAGRPGPAGCWDDIHDMFLPGNEVGNHYYGVVELNTFDKGPVRTRGLASGSFFPTGTTIITYRANDCSGNVDSLSFTVRVVDPQNPLLQIPADITLSYGSNTDTSNTGKATATDNCGIASLTYADSTSRVADLSACAHYTYTIFRKWTATDINSNVSSKIQRIHVKDSEAPIAICRNISLTLVNGEAILDASSINNGSTDAGSGIASVTVSKTNFTCSDIGLNNVVLTVMDRCGNTSTGKATVTIVGASSNCSITVAPSNNIYTDGVPTNIYLGYGPQKATLTANSTATGTCTYLWSGQTSMLSATNSKNPVFTPTAAGIYTFTVTVINSAGCTSTSNVTFCVKDVRVPDNAYGEKDGDNGNGYTKFNRDRASAGDDDKKCKAKIYLCHNSSNTLSISINAVGAHLGNHSDDKPGKCGQICGSNARQIMASETVIGSEVNVYPNPIKGSFFVDVPYFEKEATVKITDIQGRTMQKRTLKDSDDHKQRFELNNVLPGIYFVDVIFDGQRQTTKIVVQ